MQLSCSQRHAVCQRVGEGTFPVFKTRSDLSDQYVSILKLRVVRSDFPKRSTKFKIQSTVFADGVHWNERNFVFWC